MNFKFKNDKFILGLRLFSILVLLLSTLLFYNENIAITAQNDNKDDNNKNDKTNGDFTAIKTKINLNNINIQNYDRLKLVGYLNGEGQTIYIDLKDNS
ncbi:MAG: hypothetical protein ACXWFC_08870 [Nitrososphaeraceae archaeon]